MKTIQIICIFIILVSCSENEEELNKNSLLLYLDSKTSENGSVISCAASDFNTEDVFVYYFPKNGARDIRFYETNDTNVAKIDYASYSKVEIISSPFFNGYLGVFSKLFSTENWVIITYELDDEIKLSNPIRIKHITKPTVWTDEVGIDQTQSTMPKFTWTHDANGDNAIYFQVVSDANLNLLSGTYTYDNYFQFYNISNVVLNITNETPPPLIINANYNFTMMDVSLDNWVNTIIQNTFTAK